MKKLDTCKIQISTFSYIHLPKSVLHTLQKDSSAIYSKVRKERVRNG